jgi:hypothetical protein
MKGLKSLTFAAAALTNDPISVRRTRLIACLADQKALAEDPLYLRTGHRWVIQDNGVKERVEVRKRVRPWWKTDAQGKVYLTVRYGAKPIEFEKGKAAVLLQDQSHLLSALDLLIEAVKAGELDDQINQQSKSRAAPKTKRAA